MSPRESTHWHALSHGRVTAGGWTLLVELSTVASGWLWRLRDPSGQTRRTGLEKSAGLAMGHADAAAIAEGAFP